MYVIRETIRLNSKAETQPSTEKPGTIYSARKIIRILITSRKSPKVIIVIGIVKATRMGFKKAFKRANTKATITAVFASEIVTPGKNFAARKAATAVMMILNNKPITKDFEQM